MFDQSTIDPGQYNQIHIHAEIRDLCMLTIAVNNGVVSILVSYQSDIGQNFRIKHRKKTKQNNYRPSNLIPNPKCSAHKHGHYYLQQNRYQT